MCIEEHRSVILHLESFLHAKLAGSMCRTQRKFRHTRFLMEGPRGCRVVLQKVESGLGRYAVCLLLSEQV